MSICSVIILALASMTAQTADQRARPRKQPRQARARHTVDAIVEASARILEEQGHGGFNTNAVADLAGVSIGTLYQYFPDKDALLGALIARETGRLVEDAEAACLVAGGARSARCRDSRCRAAPAPTPSTGAATRFRGSSPAPGCRDPTRTIDVHDHRC